jgi:two-component system, LytTR family, response regulator
MNEIEQRLDLERFFRVHRSAIVNVDRVREMHPPLRGDCVLVLQDGDKLKLSRSRREAFRAAAAVSAKKSDACPTNGYAE